MNLLESISEFADVQPIVFDRQHALSRLGNQEELLVEILQLIQAESPRIHCQIHQSLANRQATELRRAAHTLKGSVSLVGASDLCFRLKRVEDFAEANDFENVSQALPEIDRQFDELQRQLADALSEVCQQTT